MSVSPSVTDHELIRRCAEGDEAALRALFGRYHGIVYHLLYRMLGSRDDADELLPDSSFRISSICGAFSLVISSSGSISSCRRASVPPLRSWAARQAPDPGGESPPRRELVLVPWMWRGSGGFR
jgi:hypothetical protein